MRALGLAACLLLAALWAGCAAPPQTAGLPPLPVTNFYEVATPEGAFVVELSDATPLHRDNFKRLAADGFYDGTTFHRVVRGFMIQGGDPNSRDDIPSNDGLGGPGYTLPAEIVPGLSHALGAVAAAREGDDQNPERRSSGSQFYVVTGEANHLDGAYTVFGRVVEGLDVLAALERAPTLRSQGRFAPPPMRDRPLEPLPMTVRPLPDYEAAASDG